MTVPRSQGKQPYYDARKASWGDIFPHPPKNGLEVRRRGRTQTKDAEDEGDEDVDFDVSKYTGTYEFGDTS